MFTGIVEEIGRLAGRQPGPEGALRLTFTAPVVTAGTGVGDSIAVNGCCLTVVDVRPGWWAADAVEETVRRTNLGGLSPGDPVNLERAARLSDRMGGHLVQGHVDAVGRVVSPAPDLAVAVPAGLRRYLVAKGSVTVDGCSLTVAAAGGDGFTAAVIPHTAEATTLGRRRAGDAVNLEVDVIAKYVEQLMRAWVPAAQEA